MLRKIAILFSFTLMAACTIKPTSQVTPTGGPEISTQAPMAKDKLAPTQCLKVNRGEAVKLAFKPYDGFQPEYLYCEGQSIPFQRDNHGSFQAYYGASYFSHAPERNCFLIDSQGFGYHLFNIHIHDIKYPQESLTVDAKRVTPSEKDYRRIKSEKNMLASLYRTSHQSALFSEPFSLPLGSKVTSEYGTQRVFNNSLNTQHLGTDFRAPTGTKIPSANTGKVVFSGELFLTGNTVIIDHGLGIFTAYGHLSQRFAKRGSIINKGDIVGLSGATGRVTAPHLHWDIIIHGHYVNGLKFIQDMQYNECSSTKSK